MVCQSGARGDRVKGADHPGAADEASSREDQRGACRFRGHESTVGSHAHRQKGLQALAQAAAQPFDAIKGAVPEGYCDPGEQGRAALIPKTARAYGGLESSRRKSR